jgi:beta-lactamase regulating signal transducer with metallopeptidase domain
MNFLYQSAFLKALGWALLNSLWQMALLWLVYLTLTMNGKKLLSRQRHTIALLSLTGGSLWFLITLVINLYQAASGPQVITLYVTDATAYATPSWPGIITQWFEPALPFLSLAYLLATVFLFIRFYFQYRHTQQLFTTGLQKAPPEWRIFLQQAVQQMSIKKNVQIWLSSLVDTPVTLGFLKPVILLPIAAVNHLSIKQAEAIILHELNHIRRNDYLINLLISCVDVVLFFNPFARLLTGIIRKERENCCDDLVLQFCYEPHSYARALLALEQNRIDTNVLALAATGKDKYFLLNRVKRILGKEPVGNPFNQKLVAYLFSALLIAFIGWYNPAHTRENLIIKKGGTVRFQPTATETAQSFTTPPASGIMVSTTASFTKGAPVDNNQEGTCPEQKSPYKKLEQIIELATDAKLAALDEQLNRLSEQAVGFAANIEATEDYSLPENNPVPPPPAAQQVYPYVPGTSFYSQPVEDTTLPKKYIMTITDVKAKESMEKSMKALQHVNWKKLELSFKAQGMTINMEQIQREIEKAMQQIDWKKLNAETENALDAANDEIQKLQDAFVVRSGTYQGDRTVRQERLKQAQQKILMDRLQQHEQLKKMELDDEKKKECTKKPVVPRKKIVQI